MFRQDHSTANKAEWARVEAEHPEEEGVRSIIPAAQSRAALCPKVSRLLRCKDARFALPQRTLCREPVSHLRCVCLSKTIRQSIVVRSGRQACGRRDDGARQGDLRIHALHRRLPDERPGGGGAVQLIPDGEGRAAAGDPPPRQHKTRTQTATQSPRLLSGILSLGCLLISLLGS